MSYIQPHMTKSLERHILERRGDHHYVLRRPGTGMYFVHVAEVGRHIVLTGDLTIGGPHGCVSAGGYGFDWFSRRLSEDYLCSKFLEKVWQWEIAEARMQDWLSQPADGSHILDDAHRPKIEAILSWESSFDFSWKHDTPTSHELYDALFDLSQYYVDDGPPGFGYPLADAGWLCAVNVRCAELFSPSSRSATLPD